VRWPLSPSLITKSQLPRPRKIKKLGKKKRGKKKKRGEYCPLTPEGGSGSALSRAVYSPSIIWQFAEGKKETKDRKFWEKREEEEAKGI